ncbi:MAG: tetratricopeptide repeat protein, partial [Rhodospirillales bacterium]
FIKRAQAFEREGLFNKAIEEYTQAILVDPKNAGAYFGRGWAHESQQRHDDAIRNFSQAIRLNAVFADAYFGRGWAYEQQQKIDLAIGEYGHAIKAAPDYADAYFSRGILAFLQGRLGAAAKDFTGVSKNSKGSLRDYALIWKYVAETRTGADKSEALALIKGLVSRNGLAGALVTMFAGQAGEEDILAQAASSDPKKQRENECIAFFFLGQSHLIAGDTQGAADYFRKTLATGVVNFRQYAAARIELARIQK